MDTNGELRDFLRARRARLKPKEVGLVPADQHPSHARSRRVPGLRREEIAQLAGVSVDYYARLEQGRARHVSEPILVAIADTLRLNDTERNYFFTLATTQTKQESHPTPPPIPRVRPAIHRMLEEFNSPALVLGRGLQILAMNQLARSFLFDIEAVPARDRNLAKWIFLDPEARLRYVDWEGTAADMAAVLRAEAGANPNDRLVSDLVGELAVKSQDFRRMWADHRVSACLNGAMQIKHPDVGTIEVEYEALQVHGNQDQKLILYAAPEGSQSAEALNLLASWTARPHLRESNPSSGNGAAATHQEHHGV